MFERIVAAVDADPERAQAVVAAATRLATALHAEVRVVHVREVEHPAALAVGRPGIAAPMLADGDADARALVDGLVASLRDAGVRSDGIVHSGEGSTARELLDVAGRYGASLIVVGDRGSRVTDILLGSVSHRIVHLAPCPVLVVR